MSDLAAALFNAYNAHDASGAAQLYAESGTHVDAAHPRPKQGRAAIAAGLEFFLTAFPDAAWEVLGQLADPAAAAVRYRLTGTLRADLGPYAARGQQLSLDGVAVLTLGLDGITCSEDFWDSGTFDRQMRLAPEPPISGSPHLREESRT